MEKINGKSKVLLTFLALILWLSFSAVCALVSFLILDGIENNIDASIFLVACAAIVINSFAFWGIIKILRKHYDDRNDVKLYSYLLAAFFVITGLFISLLPRDISSFVLISIILVLLLSIYLYIINKYFGPFKISFSRNMKGFYPYLINEKNVELKILDKNGMEKDSEKKLQKGDTIQAYRNNKNILELEIKDI